MANVPNLVIADADPVWTPLNAKNLVSELERTAILMRIDPDKLFSLVGYWIVADGSSTDEVAERVKLIRDNFAEAAAAGVAKPVVQDFRGSSRKTTNEMLSEWGPPFLPAIGRYSRRFDAIGHWTEVFSKMISRDDVVLPRTDPVQPRYHVHPMSTVFGNQGTPNILNPRRDILSLIEEEEDPKGFRRAMTSMFQHSKKIKRALSPVETLLVEGLGKRVPNPKATRLREEVNAIYQRIQQILRESGTRYNDGGELFSQFPLVVNAYTMRGIKQWPLEFLEQRIVRWKNAFLRTGLEWYSKMRNDSHRMLFSNGWYRRVDGEEFDPERIGNDVRINALSEIETRLLIPTFDDAMKFLGTMDFLEMNFTIEEGRELMFEYLDIKSAAHRAALLNESDPSIPKFQGIPQALAMRAAFLKNILVSNPHDGIVGDYKIWLRTRGYERHDSKIKERLDSAEGEWIEATQRKVRSSYNFPGHLSSGSDVISMFEDYMRGKMLERLTDIVKSNAEDASKFFALQLDAQTLFEANLGAPSDPEDERFVDYQDVGNDPAYSLLISLAAFPDKSYIESFDSLPNDAFVRERSMLYAPGERADLLDARTHVADVRRAVAKFYTKALGRGLATEEERASASSALMSFRLWFKRINIAPDEKFFDRKVLGEGVGMPPTFPKQDEGNLQSARYELQKATEALRTTIPYEVVEETSEIRKHSRSNLELSVSIHAWPRSAKTIEFEWKFDGGEGPKMITAETVDRVDRIFGSSGASVGSDLILDRAPKSGEYSCDATAKDEAGDIVGLGTSATRRVVTVSRCVRCGGDFALGHDDVVVDDAGRPIFTAAQCTWRVDPYAVKKNNEDRVVLGKEHFGIDRIMETWIYLQTPGVLIAPPGEAADYSVTKVIVDPLVAAFARVTGHEKLRYPDTLTKLQVYGQGIFERELIEKTFPYSVILNALYGSYEALLTYRNDERNISVRSEDPIERKQLPSFSAIENALRVIGRLRENLRAFSEYNVFYSGRGPLRPATNQRKELIPTRKRQDARESDYDLVDSKQTPFAEFALVRDLKKLVPGSGSGPRDRYSDKPRFDVNSLFFDAEGYAESTKDPIPVPGGNGFTSAARNVLLGFAGNHSDSRVAPDPTKLVTHAPARAQNRDSRGRVGRLTLVPSGSGKEDRPPEELYSIDFILEDGRVREDWDIQVIPGSFRTDRQRELEMLAKKIMEAYDRIVLAVNAAGVNGIPTIDIVEPYKKLVDNIILFNGINGST